MTIAEVPRSSTGVRTARRRPPRRPVRTALVAGHRWLSLVVGLALLVEVVSGDVLLYQPELVRLMNPAAFATTAGPVSVSAGRALATVEAQHAGATSVGLLHDGVYRVVAADRVWNVDAVTGRLLGEVVTPGWIDFVANLHECALGCRELTGHLAAVEAPVPGTGVFNDGEPLTVGGVVLGGLGLVLVALTASGVWLWFPRPRRWRSAFTMRWRRGRFARDTDLHRMLGMAALVPLLVWGVTAIGFEVGGATTLWYWAMPGTERSDPIVAAPGSPRDGRLDADAAAAVALAAVPGSRLAVLTLPEATDPRSPYDIWLSSPTDPYALTDYPGDVEVAVTSTTGRATIEYGVPGRPVGQVAWDDWSFPVHSGYVVDGWWRLIWLAFGLVPILLGITGLSTWLVRRRSARSRRRVRSSVPDDGDPSR